MDIKIKIIQVIVDNAGKFDIRTDGAVAFRDDLNAKAKLIFANYLDYLKAEGLADYVTKNQGSFNKLFLTFDTIVLTAASNPTSEELKVIKSIMLLIFKSQSLENIDLLVNSANSRKNSLGVDLLVIVVKAVVAAGGISNIQFAFEILSRISSKDYASEYLLALIKANAGQEAFLKAYIDAQKKNPDFFSRFEKGKEKEPLVVDFCKKKDMFVFASQTMTLSLLENFFKKYYLTGTDTGGIFAKRLGEYLNGIQPDKKLSECTKVLDTMKVSGKDDKKLLPPVYSVVLEAIFLVPYAKILDACKKKEWLGRISDMYDDITNAKANLKMEIRELVIITLCGQALEKDGFKGNDPADIKALVAKFDTVASAKSIDVYIDYYFQPIVNILIVWANDPKQYKSGGEAEKMFAKIIEKGTLEKLTMQIVEGIKKSKANAFPVILYLFRKLLAASSNALDKKLGEIAEDYFIRCLEKKGDRKRNFDELLKLATPEEKEPFQKYFDEFNKKYKPKGLFGF